jgi:uncharacterized protein YbjT (DUF2867 family)
MKKILVVGGTGLIGGKLVPRLTAKGHVVTIASPSRGVNSVTGEGLDNAMNGIDIVVDVTNSPSFEPKAVLEFFEKSATNLSEAEKKAHVKHHVALSVVGIETFQAESGYARAKLAQEKIIRDSGIPYTIVRATQFFEFLGAIAGEGELVKLSTGFMQPIASDDVAEAMETFTLAAPLNGVVDIAGPEKVPLNEVVSRFMKDTNDTRKVEADASFPYYGAVIHEHLIPQGPDTKIYKTGYAAWFASSKYAQAKK